MRPRAVRDLDQLRDADLMPAIAEGLELVKENAFRLERDARLLRDQGGAQGHRALISHAKEEAAKMLILLDAVRCPRRSGGVFSRHLEAFNQHLAKGIYAECYDSRPATFGEVEAHTVELRQEFYLDGPEGVDFTFRNTILDRRESGLYVDYVEADDKHFWVAPMVDATMIGPNWPYREPPVLSLVHAFDAVGCLAVSALQVIADIWRPVVMTAGFSWNPQLRKLNRQTLHAMDAKGLLLPTTPEMYATVVDRWLFPLYSLDLNREIPVNKADLRAQRDEWLYREMGIGDEW